MLASITAATLLVVLAAQYGASASKLSTKIDFLRAMDQHKKANNSSRRSLKNEADFKKVLHGTTQESSNLRKKLIAKSIVTKHPGSSSSSKASSINDVLGGDESGRKLTYMYNEDQDGTDDYFNAYGEWENGIGFDISQYSASYHRCAEVKQFDDYLASQEDTTSVFATKHFAVFRLCPEATCMGFGDDVSEIQQTDCDCKDQCSAAIMAGVGTDLTACVTSCGTQCSIWQQQQYIIARSQYSNSGSSARKLAQNYNDNNYQSSWDNFEFDSQIDDGKYTSVVGARGSGCQSNYGEYIIEVADYLGIMVEWQSNRFAEYELYCETCMYDVYMQWLADGGDARERRLTFEDFKEWDRELGNNKQQQIDCNKYPNAAECEYMINGHDYSLCPDSGYYDEDLAAKYQLKMEEKGNINFQSGKYLQPYYCQSYYHACAEYDTCAQYQKIKQVDYYSTYFECTEVSKSNGQTAYVGPHCAADGFTITIGVYSDQYCYDYIGDGVDISSFGIDLGEDGDALRSYYNSAMGATFEQLKYVESENNVCIPCKASDNMWNYNNDDAADQEDINELCVALYEYSARCDKHFRVYNSKTSTAKYADSIVEENLSCDFIDSIIMGNYNELGFVDIGTEWTVEATSGFMADNAYAQKINQEVHKVSPMQVFGLIASLMACAILGVWAATLHQSLTKAGPWRPRRGFRAATPAQEIDRQNSGIVVGRSASNTSYYMS